MGNVCQRRASSDPDGADEPLSPDGTDEPPSPAGADEPPLPAGTDEPPLPAGADEPFLLSGSLVSLGSLFDSSAGSSQAPCNSPIGSELSDFSPVTTRGAVPSIGRSLAAARLRIAENGGPTYTDDEFAGHLF